jgi:hypothetical protein
MKSKMLAVTAIAAGLSLAAAGTAAASPLSNSGRHRPAQVTGTTLEAALLQPAAFGDTFYTIYAMSSGHKMGSTASGGSIASASCTMFEAYNLTPTFGKTAQAQAGFVNSNPDYDFPYTVVEGVQYVNQFASTGAAAAYYREARSKFQSCVSFTEPNPVPDSVPGGGLLDVSTRTVTNTTVDGYPAFSVYQIAAYSELSGDTFTVDTLVVVAGTNVYQLYEISGANDEPSPAIMTELIKQVQKVY